MRTIHLVCGRDMAGVLAKAGLPRGNIFEMVDCLGEGPLPPISAKGGLKAWTRTRRTFWRSARFRWERRASPNRLYGMLRRGLEPWAGADHVAIWCAPTLDESLFFLW